MRNSSQDSNYYLGEEEEGGGRRGGGGGGWCRSMPVPARPPHPTCDGTLEPAVVFVSQCASMSSFLSTGTVFRGFFFVNDFRLEEEEEEGREEGGGGWCRSTG